MVLLEMVVNLACGTFSSMLSRSSSIARSRNRRRTCHLTASAARYPLSLHQRCATWSRLFALAKILGCNAGLSTGLAFGRLSLCASSIKSSRFWRSFFVWSLVSCKRETGSQRKQESARLLLRANGEMSVP